VGVILFFKANLLVAGHFLCVRAYTRYFTWKVGKIICIERRGPISSGSLQSLHGHKQWLPERSSAPVFEIDKNLGVAQCCFTVQPGASSTGYNLAKR
jgi:hypothetical protein